MRKLDNQNPAIHGGSIKEYETLTGLKFVPNQTRPENMAAAVIDKLLSAVAPV